MKCLLRGAFDRVAVPWVFPLKGVDRHSAVYDTAACELIVSFTNVRTYPLSNILYPRKKPLKSPFFSLCQG